MTDEIDKVTDEQYAAAKNNLATCKNMPLWFKSYNQSVVDSYISCGKSVKMQLPDGEKIVSEDTLIQIITEEVNSRFTYFDPIAKKDFAEKIRRRIMNTFGREKNSENNEYSDD